MRHEETKRELQQILLALQAEDDYLILCHAHPDGDAVGSAEALRLLLQFLGKKAVCACADPLPSYLQFLPEKPFLTAKDPLPAFRQVLCVDTAQIHLLGSFSELAETEGVYLKLDHHRTGDAYATREYTDERASAAGEVLFDLANLTGALQSPIGQKLATAIYCAIAADTGCFRFSNTSGKTLRIGAALFDLGVETGILNSRLFDNRPLSTARATALGLLQMELLAGGRAAILLFTNKMKESGGFSDEDLSGLSGSMRGIEGVEVAACLRQTTEDPTKFRLSCRSGECFDCTALCARFGGGGHLRAAGATIIASSPEEALQTLKEAMVHQL